VGTADVSLRRLCRPAGRGVLLPGSECLGANCAIGSCGKSVPTWTKMAIDARVGGEEHLDLLGRLEPLHLPHSSSCRTMRVLGPIIQISALSVFTSEPVHAERRHSCTSCPSRSPAGLLQTRQKPPEEALGRTGIVPGLNKNVEHNTILIDGPPEIVPHALDPDEAFVHMPLVASP
jgi:hypothetical protein